MTPSPAINACRQASPRPIFAHPLPAVTQAPKWQHTKERYHDEYERADSLGRRRIHGT